MKGLLLKDTYVLCRQMKLFFFLILALTILPGNEFTGFAIMYSAMMPMTAIGYDERSKWDELAAMMPYSCAQLVISKYLLGYMFGICACLAAFAMKLLTSAAGITAFTAGDASLMLMYMFAAFIIAGIDLPLMFRLGAEKGRLLLIFITIAIAMACTSGSQALLSALSLGRAGSLAFLPVLVIAAVVINVLSILISINIYKKKRK